MRSNRGERIGQQHQRPHNHSADNAGEAGDWAQTEPRTERLHRHAGRALDGLRAFIQTRKYTSASSRQDRRIRTKRLHARGGPGALTQQTAKGEEAMRTAIGDMPSSTMYSSSLACEPHGHGLRARHHNKRHTVSNTQRTRRSASLQHLASGPAKAAVTITSAEGQSAQSRPHRAEAGGHERGTVKATSQRVLPVGPRRENVGAQRNRHACVSQHKTTR